MDTPPKKVSLVYRQILDHHVFTCPEIPGLHISNFDFCEALTRAIIGLQRHAAVTFNCAVQYELQFPLTLRLVKEE